MSVSETIRKNKDEQYFQLTWAGGKQQDPFTRLVRYLYGLKQTIS